MSNTHPTILVTGAGGFLGGVIARMLVEKGERVRSLSRSRYASLDALGVEQIEGDLGNYAAVQKAVEGISTIYHVAAKAGVWGKYGAFYRANVIGTRNLLSAAKEAGVSRFVYTSSPSVVFDGTDMEGVDESVPYPASYKAPYPETKAMAEQLVIAANSPEMATVSLRPHLIWGPGDNHLVPRIVARGRKGQLRRIGNRPCLVDTVYVDNAAEAHLLAADRLAPGSPVAGKCYFITQDAPIPLWEMVDRILACAELPPVTRSISPKIARAAGAFLEHIYSLFHIPVEPRMTTFVASELSTAHWFDISASKRDFGYTPRVSTEEGLVRLREWIAAGGLPK